ncbi:hypothetical protein [Faecalibacillus intestinalis]|jgi:integral membrane protein (TIGR03766 family)|uniref:hypothetical protein n=1 Tax=Faecalibacillus intestinalis TaxID=1982626 RepID=UPI000E51BCF9|nr:hypothetical protein [Faecalibacillus intestinalis]RHR84882.1 hypothetical protein DWW38_13535 [Coprobacillus sp. AF15-30]
MKSKKKIYSLFYNFLIILFGLMMIGIVLVDLFVAGRSTRVQVRIHPLSNLSLLVIALFTLIVLIIFYKKLLKKYVDLLNKKQCSILLMFYFLVAFALQIFLIKKIFFLTGWDVGQLRCAADQAAQGLKFQSGNEYNYYFSFYPNNVFILFISTIITKVAYIIGMDSHLLLSIVGALSVNVSIILLVKIVGLITHNKHLCVLAIFISTIFIMFTPWIIIPYSDTYAMFFTTVVLYVYLNKDNLNKYVSAFFIVLFAFIGYKVKPTVIIVLIAIILIEVWKNLFNLKNIKLKEVGKCSISLIAAMAIFLSISSISNSYLEYEKNTSNEMPLTHFLMMGMNPIARGGYSQDDVDFTQSHIGLYNKTSANMKVVKRRLREYGIIGYSQLLIDKSIRNYNDGSFAWGGEGNFYLVVNEDNSRGTTLLRNIFYNEGKYYQLFETFLQSVWILILFFNIFSLKNIRNYKLLVIPLSIIGITIFLLLFESRARYLLLYAPFYIILFVIGMNNIINMVNIKLENNSKIQEV